MQFFEAIFKMFGRAVFEVIEVKGDRMVKERYFCQSIYFQWHAITIIEHPLAHSSIISVGTNTNHPIVQSCAY